MNSSNYPDWVLYPDGPEDEPETDLTCACGGAEVRAEERKEIVNSCDGPGIRTYYPLVCPVCGSEYERLEDLEHDRAEAKEESGDCY